MALGEVVGDRLRAGVVALRSSSPQRDDRLDDLAWRFVLAGARRLERGASASKPPAR